jgi:S1-C subfamily serine protease
MWKSVSLFAFLIALVGCGSVCHDRGQVQPVQEAPQTAAEVEHDIPPTSLLLHLGKPAWMPGGDSGEIQPLQALPAPARGTRPNGWTWDPPLDVGGAMPSDESVRSAIVKAVKYVLDTQAEDGSWDVELSGTILSDTADDAVDAIAATGLAGVALRYHVKVDPERIEAALRKAAEFVIDRVYRGKLPMGVWYANWRYTLGLKFLTGEYKATTDEKFKNDILAVSRRMVNSMMRLQRSKTAPPLLEKKRKARLTARARRNAAPSTLGVILAPPTDTDYRGGALVERVKPGSQAEVAGIKPGMRITKAEGLTVENALDYYQLEAEWIGGQTVRVYVKNESGGEDLKSIKLDALWPGYLGIKLSPSVGLGPVVADFLPFSPARGDLEKGDIITEIDRNEIKSIEDVQNLVEKEIRPGDRVRFKVLRGEKQRSKSATVEATAAPEGTFWLEPKDEDKGSEGGIVVEDIQRDNAPAAEAGIKKDDRIIRIGDTPIIGYDHYVDFLGTVPAGTMQKITWISGGQEQTADIIASPTPQPFYLTFDWIPNPAWGQGWEAVVRAVDRGGPADRAGLKPGDMILAVNDVAVPDFFDFLIELYTLSAGEYIKLKVSRGGKEAEVTYELPKADLTKDPETVEEGGWYYYPQYDDAPSFATASAVLVLHDIDENVKGIRIPKESLKAAGRFLHNLRINDKDNGNEETYLYSSDAKSEEPRAAAAIKNLGLRDLRGCQGRNCVCELALNLLGERGRAPLKRMVDQFIDNRHHLDRVRRMELYVSGKYGGSPHSRDYYCNASYYWLYGHYHALLAAKESSNSQFKKVNEICVKALMQTKYADGLWLGHPSFGKLCGTCEALWILGETEGGWRDGYTPTGGSNPTTQPDKE